MYRSPLMRPRRPIEHPWLHAPSLYVHAAVVVLGARSVWHGSYWAAGGFFAADIFVALVSLPAMVSAALRSTPLRLLLGLVTLYGCLAAVAASAVLVLGYVGTAFPGYHMRIGLFESWARHPSLLSSFVEFIASAVSLVGIGVGYVMVSARVGTLLLFATPDAIRSHFLFRGLLDEDGLPSVRPPVEPAPPPRLNPLLDVRSALSQVSERGDAHDRALAERLGLPALMAVLTSPLADATLMRNAIWAAAALAASVPAEQEAALKQAVTALLNDRRKAPGLTVAEEARVALVAWPRR